MSDQSKIPSASQSQATSPNYEFKVADFTDHRVIAMLKAHHATVTDPASNVPGEKRYALDLDALQQPDIQLWTVWSSATPLGSEVLLGCAALKILDHSSGEIKSMHTAATARGQGVGAVTLAKLVEKAKESGLRTLYLETGSLDAFAAARRFYAGQGFVECGPFGSYEAQKNSFFMRKEIA